MIELASIPEVLLDLADASSDVEVRVHDASRLAWNLTVPLGADVAGRYTFELELELPIHALSAQDPWGQLQSYARLDSPAAPSGADPGSSAESVRRVVLQTTGKLARAKEGFARHCALIRGAGTAQGNEEGALLLWVLAAKRALAQGRDALAFGDAGTSARAQPSARQERALGDEFLSAQFWAMLTDCARALVEVRRVFEEAPDREPEVLDAIERAIAAALEEEIAHRRRARFAHAEPANARQLEQFLQRTRWLKRHFERVLFLEPQTYHVTQRLGSWFSAAAAVMAYLWFFGWQLALEHRRTGAPSAVGSGLVAFALVTAVVYASREKLKEGARNWLAGRIQRLYAQRIARYRLRTNTKATVVVSARESFSQSTATRPDPVDPASGSKVEVTVLRFSHRGASMPGANERASQVRLVFRYDLSAIFPRLHDAVKGLAVPDPDTRRLVITDVPRNYEVPVRATLRTGARTCVREGAVILNKNGLLRFDERAAPSPASDPSRELVADPLHQVHRGRDARRGRGVAG